MAADPDESREGEGLEGVKELRLGDLKRLGIDSRHQLFWDGKRVELRQRFDLTGWQRFGAVVITLFAILGGLGGFFSGLTDASAFLCARNLHWLSCPLPAPR